MDRINALTVILDDDYKEEELERLCDAIEMLSGVLRVRRHVATLSDAIAKDRAVSDLSKKLYKVLYDYNE